MQIAPCCILTGRCVKKCRVLSVGQCRQQLPSNTPQFSQASPPQYAETHPHTPLPSPTPQDSLPSAQRPHAAPAERAVDSVCSGRWSVKCYSAQSRASGVAATADVTAAMSVRRGYDRLVLEHPPGSSLRLCWRLLRRHWAGRFGLAHGGVRCLVG